MSHSDYDFSADITAGPVPEAVLSWRLPDGEVFPLRLYRVHIHAKRESGHLSGLLGAYVHIEDAAYLYWRLLPEDESLSLQTVVNSLVGSLDGDVVPEGPTDVPCDEEGYDADCPFGASRCEDGRCYHVPGIPEGISMTLAFSAVWCEITGVARD
jgi:hypothetical protein